ncbi:MAG TPA: hypothetical protein VMT10_01635 [Solirubrobacteraceae bacterium]|nr:hypothetical protein [Solirubrobacteraceae bacterium]
MPVLAIAVLLLTAGIHAPTASAASWRWPVTPHRVLAPFRFSRAAPFTRGARRGVLLAGRPGAAVGSACSGRVRYAGRLPSAGLGVSVRCGPLVATHLGLAALAVVRGARVAAGEPLGVLPAGGTMRLGARVASRRQGYLDPARLLGGAGSRWRPLGPAPAGARRRPPLRAPRPTPAARRSSAGVSAQAALAAAWLGLGLLGSALGAGIVLRRRRPPSGACRRLPGAPLAFSGDGRAELLRHDADLLRERGAASGARVHDDRR